MAPFNGKIFGITISSGLFFECIDYKKIMMNQDIFTIQPTGNFDSRQAKDFREQIKQAIASQVQCVLLDCQAVKYIDSSGLGELILAMKSLRAVDGRLVLCSINDQIETLFLMTDMFQVFDVYPDRKALLETE